MSLPQFVLYTETLSSYVTLCEHGAVRLEDGNSFDEGRVEVCFEDHWATICDHQWNEEDAEVVCRQLGHSGGIICISLLTLWAHLCACLCKIEKTMYFIFASTIKNRYKFT